MRITRFYARNILTFGDEGFEWDEIGPLNVIVGPNASGKTNILRLLELVGNAFYLRNPAGPQRLLSILPLRDSLIEVEVELTKAERATVVDLIVATIKLQSVNWQPPQTNPNEAERIARSLLDRRTDLFYDIVRPRIRLCVKTRSNPARLVDIYARLGTSDWSINLTPNGLTKTEEVTSGWYGIELKTDLFDEFQKKNPGVAKLGPKLVTATEKQLRDVANSLDHAWLRKKFEFAESPTLPKLLHLIPLEFSQYEAAQASTPSDLMGLRSFLFNRNWGAPQIGALDLLGVIYRSSILRLADIRSRPADMPLNVPQSELELQQVRLIDGTKLAPELFDLKTNPDADRRASFAELTDFYERLTGLSVDTVQYVAASTDGQQNRYASIRIAGLDYEVPLEYAAAGQVELLVFLYALNSTHHGVLLLDEPALNLHPAFQRRLFIEMLSRARLLKNQLLVVTHSPSFVGTDQLNSVIRICPGIDGKSSIHRFTGPSRKTEAQDRKWLQRYPELLSALFARGVLLVEGPDEAAGLPIWFRKCAGKDRLAEQSILTISVDGKGNFCNFAEVLDGWGIPFRVLGDGDARPETSKFGKLGRSYRQRDYVKIMKKFTRPEFQKALRAIGRSGEKDPAVAREVALETPPPPPVKALWNWVRPFVEAPTLS